MQIDFDLQMGREGRLMETILSMSDVARSLDVSGQTIKNWVDNDALSSFFSAAARGGDGRDSRSRRSFTTDELYMLNTVRAETSKTPPGQRVNWEAVAARLRAGDVDRVLPASSITATNNIAPVVAIEQMTRYRVENEVQAQQIGKLEHQLEAEREARRQNEERLNREIGELRYENRLLRKQVGKPPAIE